jgi:hypothetical protein
LRGHFWITRETSKILKVAELEKPWEKSKRIKLRDLRPTRGEDWDIDRKVLKRGSKFVNLDRETIMISLTLDGITSLIK